ncbi:hypothetical protein [Marisediminicola senii]|uniref:hypothetical protein n=1 Tax=Marisediminicola senii TaxID=2711233 RepID=UPI0013EADA03|nr:hypothetical protein [Marisediminicola senii]
MNDETPDDIPTELTRLLRNVDGVHTVYPTRHIVSTIVTAVVEAVRNDPVGMHLVTVTEGDDGTEVVANIGVAADQSASMVCRRAHDALRAYFADSGSAVPRRIRVSVGRVG